MGFCRPRAARESLFLYFPHFAFLPCAMASRFLASSALGLLTLATASLADESAQQEGMSSPSSHLFSLAHGPHSIDLGTTPPPKPEIVLRREYLLALLSCLMLTCIIRMDAGRVQDRDGAGIRASCVSHQLVAWFACQPEYRQAMVMDSNKGESLRDTHRGTG